VAAVIVVEVADVDPAAQEVVVAPEVVAAIAVAARANAGHRPW
jgi:hypothetical protein